MSPGGAGGSQPLANLLVQFQLAGQAELEKALAASKQGVEALATSVGQFALHADTSFRGIIKGIQEEKAERETLRQKFLQMGVAADQVAAHVDAYQKAQAAALVQLERATEKAAREGEKNARELAASWTAVGTAINTSLALGTGAIAGFVRQGMAAGIQGQFFQIALERLSLAMSGLFRPELEKLLGLIDRVTSYLSSLTDAQRGNLARWIEGAAAASALGLILPRVLGGVQALAGGFRALQAAITGTLSSTGIGALIPLLGLAVEGMTALLIGTRGGRDALSRLAEPVAALGKALQDLGQQIQLNERLEEAGRAMGELVVATAKLVSELARVNAQLDRIGLGMGTALRNATQLATANAFMHFLAGPEPPKRPEADRGSDIRRAGGFEDLGATYRRIALASSRVGGGKPPEERTADATERSETILDLIRRAVESPRPEIAR